MAILCSCRAISGHQVNEFLSQTDAPVTIKTIVTQCGATPEQCCGHRDECNKGIRDVVKTHNEKVTPLLKLLPSPG